MAHICGIPFILPHCSVLNIITIIIIFFDLLLSLVLIPVLGNNFSYFPNQFKQVFIWKKKKLKFTNIYLRFRQYLTGR